MDIGVRIPFCEKGQVEKHNSYDHGHRRGTDQKHVAVLELLRLSQLEDEAVVYARLSPRKDVAAVEKEVKEQ